MSSEAASPVSLPLGGPQSTMNRKKILVVDDSLVILKTMSMKLTANGYNVVTAEDGSGNVLTGYAGTVAITTSGGSLSGTAFGDGTSARIGATFLPISLPMVAIFFSRR